MKTIKQLLALLNRILFPLNRSISRYHRMNNENYVDYCKNLTDEYWDVFQSKLMRTLKHKGEVDSQFHIETVDLRKEWDRIVQNNEPGFVSSIKGTSLKGIMLHSHLGVLPAKGVMNLTYEKGKGASCALFTVSPTSISFFQTPTGGLAVTIRPPQSEGLMKNTPEVIVYRLFRRISDVTEYDLLKALKFFLTCAREKALWGEPTIFGRLEYQWVTRIRATILPRLLSMLEDKLKSLVS